MTIDEEKFIKRIEFERKWLKDLASQNKLTASDIDIAFSSIKYMLRECAEWVDLEYYS